MLNYDFLIDADIKLEYLNSKPINTAKSDSFVLKKVDAYEAEKNKKVYDLSIPELKELLALYFDNKSQATVDKNASIIRKYIDFCISKGIVNHYENRLNIITRKDLREIVNQLALDFKYITPDEMDRYLGILFNEQDRALIYCPYIGIKGRPDREGTFEEIINLQINEKSNDFKNNVLKLIKNNGEIRFIQVDDKAMDILVEAKNQEVYYSNNGEPAVGFRGGLRRFKINKIGDYVFRNTGKSKYELLNPILINSRIQKIQTWTGNPCLTINSLYMSGMINMARKIKEEKGELTTIDYVSICERFDYGSGDPTKYVQKLRDIVRQYI